LSIFPDLSGFNLIDFDQVPDLLEAGYRAALPALKLWAEGKQ
jgi:NTE family protein